MWDTRNNKKTYQYFIYITWRFHLLSIRNKNTYIHITEITDCRGRLHVYVHVKTTSQVYFILPNNPRHKIHIILSVAYFCPPMYQEKSNRFWLVIIKGHIKVLWQRAFLLHQSTPLKKKIGTLKRSVYQSLLLWRYKLINDGQ